MTIETQILIIFLILQQTHLKVNFFTAFMIKFYYFNSTFNTRRRNGKHALSLLWAANHLYTQEGDTSLMSEVRSDTQNHQRQPSPCPACGQKRPEVVSLAVYAYAHYCEILKGWLYSNGSKVWSTSLKEVPTVERLPASREAREARQTLKRFTPTICSPEPPHGDGEQGAS